MITGPDNPAPIWPQPPGHGLLVRTARLVLRPPQPNDRAEYVRMHTVSEEHFAPWLPALSDIGATSYDELFERHLARSAEGLVTGACLRLVALTHGGGGRIVGCFNLNNIIRGMFLNADAGWHVSADAAGRGYATEAMSAVLTLAFLPEPLPAEGAPQRGTLCGLGLHRVQAGVIPENVRSIRVAEKLKMRREGVARRYLRIAGSWQDHIIFALTAEETEAVNANAPTGSIQHRGPR